VLIAFILFLILVALCGGQGCIKGLLSLVFGAMLLMVGCAVV
jgi:hypothetical protein